MIATRTPFRISFVGGGTDLPAFYTRCPGAVISTTINKYMFIFVHDFFHNQIQLKYSQTELVDRIEDLRHPIAREVLSRFVRNGGIDVNSVADVPAGTGLGSSSAFTVGLLRAMYAHHGMQVSKQQLAEDACHIEIDVLKSPIGKQDQFASAFGGLNLIEFCKDGRVVVKELPQSQLLERSMMLFQLGDPRDANVVLSDQNRNIEENDEVFRSMVKMSWIPYRFAASLVVGDLEDCGHLLDANWQLKKQLSSYISNGTIDEFYTRAIAAGALGGKLIGAGGGGFLLLLARPDKQEAIRSELSELRELRVWMDRQGSAVLNMGL